MMPITCSLRDARTLALHAQGLTQGNGSEPPPSPEGLLGVIKQLGCLQIDTLQRVQRTQYIVPWSRLGGYDPRWLDQLAYADVGQGPESNGRQIFEAWYHAACYLPLDEFRFRLPRMESSRIGRHERTRSWLALPETQELLNEVFDRIKQEGGLRARDFEHPRGKRGEWWDWKPAKTALEHLFARGDLLIADRVRFERIYDLADRVIPDWVNRNAPSADDAALHVLERSAKALGICTRAQIADYAHDYRRNTARPYLEHLEARGVLVPVRVQTTDGNHEFVMHQGHEPTLRAVQEGELIAGRTTFLSPFDPLFYPKGRDEQLWGFRQILEAYKPAAQRQWGYFCLPILHRDSLVGRLDPRLDRKAGLLHLEALYLEPGIEPEHRLITAIAVALQSFMDFHQAHDLVIEKSQPRSFGPALKRALAATSRSPS